MDQQNSQTISVFYYQGRTTLNPMSASLEVHGNNLKLSSADSIIFDEPFSNIRKIASARTWFIYMSNGEKYALGTAFGKTASGKELKTWLQANPALKEKFADYSWVTYTIVPVIVIAVVVIILIVHH